MTDVSKHLADVLSSTRYADLPAQTVVDAKRAVLDWLGSALAGALEPPARMAQQVVAGLGTSDEATVFAAGGSSAAGAALANGVASHILELDDVHKGSTIHAAAPVIPAALAVAEREHLSGRDFLLAVTLGYDAAFRVGEAVNPSHYRFFHPTGTAATFGAAVAAGSLLGLDAKQMLDALGSAGTQAAGLWEFNADGTMSKHLHPGKAAFNGVLSADLAKAGFTGAGKILEGNRGFFRAMSASFDPSRVTDGLGQRWKVSENCYKVWSCCGHTHTAVDVAADISSERWAGEPRAHDVASISIETYGPGYEIVKEPNPRSTYEAKFSIAYCVAAALLYAGAPLEAFSDDHFRPDGVTDRDLVALLERTTVTVAPDLTAKYPGAWPTRIRVTFTDGTEINRASDFPLGNPENPVSTSYLEEKFRALVLPGWGDAVATRAIDALHSLESCVDMSMAFSEFAADPVPVEE
ncbi:MAG TPA: MmgE/PrpD family protein [Gemmatimonadaceae bacterium]